MDISSTTPRGANEPREEVSGAACDAQNRGCWEMASKSAEGTGRETGDERREGVKESVREKRKWAFERNE